jgi:hypothetical protein
MDGTSSPGVSVSDGLRSESEAMAWKVGYQLFSLDQAQFGASWPNKVARKNPNDRRAEVDTSTLPMWVGQSCPPRFLIRFFDDPVLREVIAGSVLSPAEPMSTIQCSQSGRT